MEYLPIKSIEGDHYNSHNMHTFYQFENKNNAVIKTKNSHAILNMTNISLIVNTMGFKRK